MLLHVASPIVRHLVAADDEPQSILHAKLGGDVCAELDADAALRLELPRLVGRVAPHEVGKHLVLHVRGLGMRRRHRGVVDGIDVVDGHPGHPRQAAVHDENLLLDDAAQGHGLEGAGEAPVGGQSVLPHHLVDEPAAAVAVQGVHVLVFMIAPVQDDALLIGQEEAEQHHQDLDAIRPPVNHVAVEQESVGLRRQAARIQDVQHIRQLPVRVADDD
mmetsp:Transcript_56306/g.163301  ORF Transcript_56306/g.163301 Transcript_56306/m.163301 type:complete len:217 (-) Transcript_56306:773-1423(-)